ncbi:MAG: hypothetical protein IPI04_05790 [Ignavibacteria bacterium]|nr:hypothetical protein [Ignavibacteria bacterium]
MYEQTFLSIDAFRHYLKSEKLIAEEQKFAHYEFMKYLSDLTKLKSDGLKNNKVVNLSMLRKKLRE